MKQQHTHQHTQIPFPKRFPIVLKIILIILLVSSYSVYWFLWNGLPGRICIIDQFHDWLFQFNRLLTRGWQPWIIGASQICIDGWGIIMGTVWVAKIKNFRLPTALGALFAVRTLFLYTQKFPFPQYLVWDSPGFPSIAVPYDHTRDFFYSGHTGLLFLAVVEFKTIKYYKFAFVCFICLLYTILVLLTTRAHYIADVFGGLVYSKYLHQFAFDFIYYFDFAFSVPYWLGYKVYLKCKKKKSQINQQNKQITDTLIIPINQ